MSKYDFTLAANAEAIDAEANWLCSCISKRIETSMRSGPLKLNQIDYGTGSVGSAEIAKISPPRFENRNSAYGDFLAEHGLGPMDRLLLMLSLINHVQPGRLSQAILSDATDIREKQIWGQIKTQNSFEFIPSGLTFVFLAGGYNLPDRFRAMQIFSSDHIFANENVLELEPQIKGEPSLSGKLYMPEFWVEYFSSGIFPEVGASIKHPPLALEAPNLFENRERKHD